MDRPKPGEGLAQYRVSVDSPARCYALAQDLQRFLCAAFPPEGFAVIGLSQRLQGDAETCRRRSSAELVLSCPTRRRSSSPSCCGSLPSDSARRCASRLPAVFSHSGPIPTSQIDV
jgi:hypothetical protein